jgi:hypothetical protein
MKSQVPALSIDIGSGRIVYGTIVKRRQMSLRLIALQIDEEQ